MDLGNQSWILQYLLRRRLERLLLVLFVLKQEGELLKRLAKRLREEEVDEDNLEAEPADVHQQILPSDVFQTNGVDKAACALSANRPAERI